jgi:uncharacterized protein YkwD
MGRRALARVHLAVLTASLVLVPSVSAAERCSDTELMPTASNLSRVEAALVCLLNRERARAGSASLMRDARLERTAFRHTRDMVEHGFFGHRREGGPTLLARLRRGGYFKRSRSALYGENLGYATPERATAATMTRAFSLSESHRATMLFGRFRDVGVGSALIDPHPAFYADHPAVVFTVDFGRRYERRRRCRAASVVEDGSRDAAVPPRRWCRGRKAA